MSARVIRQSVRCILDGSPEPREMMKLMARIANANAEAEDALAQIERIATMARRSLI